MHPIVAILLMICTYIAVALRLRRFNKVLTAGDQLSDRELGR